MKKSIIKKSLLTTLCLILSINVFATNTLDDIKKMPVDYVPIIVTRKPANANMHRGLIQDVEAYYQNEYIYIVFNLSIEYVSIEVLNVGNGFNVVTNVDTNNQQMTHVDIGSGGCGTYTITITTQTGVYYIGELTL